MLATWDDANRFLDKDKVQFYDDVDAADDRESAETYVTAALSTIIGADVVGSWTLDPTPPQVAPPAIVTDVVAMFMAAARYRKRYSLEQDIENNYGRQLYDEAQALLTKMTTGEITVVPEVVIAGAGMAEEDFWPNDTYVNSDGTPNRKFTMDMEF